MPRVVNIRSRPSSVTLIREITKIAMERFTSPHFSKKTSIDREKLRECTVKLEMLFDQPSIMEESKLLFENQTSVMEESRFLNESILNYSVALPNPRRLGLFFGNLLRPPSPTTTTPTERKEDESQWSLIGSTSVKLEKTVDLYNNNSLDDTLLKCLREPSVQSPQNSTTNNITTAGDYTFSPLNITTCTTIDMSITLDKYHTADETTLENTSLFTSAKEIDITDFTDASWYTCREELSDEEEEEKEVSTSGANSRNSSTPSSTSSRPL